jgi:NADPH:quinone reductase-like Zn-dependent oxidoreductase
VIDDMQGLDAMPLKTKALSLHWELMFTRSMLETPDMGEQGALLAEVAALVDAGRVRSTVSTSFGSTSAHNLHKAHAQIESGKAHGRVVLAGR